MKKLLVVLSLACLALAGFSARGQSIIDPNNTVVRLSVITNGVLVGNIDIELFDREKPETVRNFLMYVYSGAYSNLVIHQMEQHQWIQVGHVRPLGTNAFADFEHVDSFGDITSEYSTKPIRGNDFGTIAMVPGLFHGSVVGSADWIINLANNTSLNTNNGYVVFGHVVNTAGAGGTNLLNYLGTFEQSVNIRGFTFGNVGGEGLNLPVTVLDFQRAPQVSELFLIDVAILQNGRSRDTTAPTIQLSQPGSDTNLDVGGPLLFAGTAFDNQRVARVIYDYGFPYQRFSTQGTSNWMSRVSLLPETNHISVRAVDDFGNLSDPIERTVYYPYVDVSLAVSGKGKVTGVTNGQSFRLGTTNIFQAKPLARNYFYAWAADNGAVSGSSAITFVADGGIRTLYAYFTRTLLGLSNGVYNGLFFPTNNGSARTAGWITLNLAPSGEYFGRLSPVGTSYQIHGKLDSTGYSGIGGLFGTNTLGLQLYLTDPGSESLSGIFYLNGQTANVSLLRVQKGTRTKPVAQAGSYSFLIRPTDDTNTAGGEGYGFGCVTIDATGRIKMTGTLGDGMAIHQNAAMVKGGFWPIFALANVGWAGFANNNVFAANLDWWSPNFPGNTNQTARLDGGPYNPIGHLNWSNGTITLSGDDLDAPLSADVMLSENGSITVLSNPNNIQFGLPDKKGLITGSFTHPFQHSGIRSLEFT